MKELRFTIPLNCRSKKTSQQIYINPRTKRPFITQSKIYKQYEKDCKVFIPKVETINYPVNVKALFYRQTRHKIDLTNLQQAIADIMVKYGLLSDDNYTIIESWDGSRVFIDKDNPRSEITITQK